MSSPENTDMGFSSLNSDITRIGSHIQNQIGETMRNIFDEFQKSFNQMVNFFDDGDVGALTGKQRIIVSNGDHVRVIHVDYTANQKPLVDDGIMREPIEIDTDDYVDQNWDQRIECFPYRAPLIVYTMLGVLLLIMTGFLTVLYNRRRQLRQLQLLQQRTLDNREEFRANCYKPFEQQLVAEGTCDKPPTYEKVREDDKLLPKYEEIEKTETPANPAGDNIV